MFYRLTILGDVRGELTKMGKDENFEDEGEVDDRGQVFWSVCVRVYAAFRIEIVCQLIPVVTGDREPKIQLPQTLLAF